MTGLPSVKNPVFDLCFFFSHEGMV